MRSVEKVYVARMRLKYFTVIIELDSTLPRRETDKPHLYIGTSTSTPDERLRQLQQGSGPAFARGHFLSVFEESPYSKPTSDLDVANRRLDETIEKYSQ